MGESCCNHDASFVVSDNNLLYNYCSFPIINERLFFLDEIKLNACSRDGRILPTVECIYNFASGQIDGEQVAPRGQFVRFSLVGRDKTTVAGGQQLSWPITTARRGGGNIGHIEGYFPSGDNKASKCYLKGDILKCLCW